MMSKGDEAEEDDIGPVKREKILRKPLNRQNYTLGLVAPSVRFVVVLPGRAPIALQRNHWPETPLPDQLAGRVVFVRAVHEQGRTVRQRRHPVRQPAHLQGVVRVAGGERAGNGCPGIRGNHVKSGVPAAPGPADEP